MSLDPGFESGALLLGRASRGVGPYEAAHMKRPRVRRRQSIPSQQGCFPPSIHPLPQPEAQLPVATGHDCDLTGQGPHSIDLRIVGRAVPLQKGNIYPVLRLLDCVPHNGLLAALCIYSLVVLGFPRALYQALAWLVSTGKLPYEWASIRKMS